jgi:predicted RNA-binding protein associated with RNAse of E/G family
MTEPSRDDEVVVTDSGGTMRRMTGPSRDVVPDLDLLASLRRIVQRDGVRPSGPPPYFAPGDVITWYYGASADVLRVVRDDERGLVAWLPSGSERLAATPRDGRGVRDRSLEERAALAVAHDYDLTVVAWSGPGVLRIVPAGRPWSIWYFREDDGTFAGHYLNLELPHERPVDGSLRTHTRDLTLDVWVENGEAWLKDSDELEAGVAAGWCTAEQAAVIHAVAEQARREQVDARSWPLDEAWETWSPPSEWDEPLSLPEAAVDAVSKTGEPVRRPGTTS